MFMLSHHVSARNMKEDNGQTPRKMLIMKSDHYHSISESRNSQQVSISQEIPRFTGHMYPSLLFSHFNGTKDELGDH